MHDVYTSYRFILTDEKSVRSHGPDKCENAYDDYCCMMRIGRQKVFHREILPENNNITVRPARTVRRCPVLPVIPIRGIRVKSDFSKSYLFRYTDDTTTAPERIGFNSNDFLSKLPNYISWYVSRWLLVQYIYIYIYHIYIIFAHTAVRDSWATRHDDHTRHLGDRLE